MSTEKQYILAFNNGYVLAQYKPELLNTISQNLAPSNNYLRAFFAGKEQLELENNKDQMFELQQLRSRSQNKEKNFERDG